MMEVVFVLITTTGVPRLPFLLEVEVILMQDLLMAIIEVMVEMVVVGEVINGEATIKAQKSLPMMNFLTVTMFLLETLEWN